MPRGRLTKVDMESRIFKLYEELDKSNHPYNHKEVAKEYLRRVMDIIKEYSLRFPFILDKPSLYGFLTIVKFIM